VENITHFDTTLPSDFKLLQGETVLRVTNHPARNRTEYRPSSIREMLRLTRASSPNDIGKSGPAIAALSLHADSGEAPEHLRLYETIFGRDSLRVAIDLISSYPQLARATTLELAKLQGLEDNTEREEELGRIVHEVRDPNDPIALELTKTRGWGWPYYATVDATPEFIRTLTAYAQRSEENRAFLGATYEDRYGNTQTMSHALELALLWINRRLSSNEEGILEYQTPLEFGAENQVWKDSWDAYHHADGSLANHKKGIASIEVQVTAYDALIDAAELYEDILDSPERAEQLRIQASQLKDVILDLFWTEDKDGYFVLGTDRDETGHIRQLKVRTSNMGHVLNSRLLKGDDPEIVRKRDAVVRHILSPEMLNASGIRTLASDEVRFRAGAYQNGSVWLWDTHHIAKGLRRLGYKAEANDLDHRILNVVNHTHMFPEYVRGDDNPNPHINTQTIVVWDSINNRENVIEQPPQEVQAWTVAAILATKQRLGRNI
jgi:glycogen debranching enzyme